MASGAEVPIWTLRVAIPYHSFILAGTTPFAWLVRLERAILAMDRTKVTGEAMPPD